MAQTTRPASFGPVFVIITFHLPSCSVFGSLQHIDTVKNKLVTRKHERNKKTLTNGPNDVTGVVWARFCRHHLSFPFL